MVERSIGGQGEMFRYQRQIKAYIVGLCTVSVARSELVVPIQIVAV